MEEVNTINICAQIAYIECDYLLALAEVIIFKIVDLLKWGCNKLKKTHLKNNAYKRLIFCLGSKNQINSVFTYNSYYLHDFN